MIAEHDDRIASLRSLLVERPKHAKSMFQLATLLTERSKQETEEEVERKIRNEAISLARHAIQVAPQKPFGYAALSVASYQFEERIEALQKAADWSKGKPQHAIARLGFLVRLLVEPREQESRKVRSDIAKGSHLHPLKRGLNADENSTYRDIQSTLSTSWELKNLTIEQKEVLCKQEYRLGLFFRKKLPAHVHQPRARQHLQKSLEIQIPKNFEMANFWLATMSKDFVIDKCPASYIVGLYSSFAERFDDLLVERLHYQTPTKLRKLLDQVLLLEEGGTRTFESGLDLGCGTGLSGLAFSDIVHTMKGVDLSAEMAEKAKSRSCYATLDVGDVAEFLSKYSAENGKAGIILACDVFCYIGDLSHIFASAREVLSNNGYFCFSTEHLNDDDHNNAPYRLHDCARFAHTCSYVRELAESHNFQIAKLSIEPIRKNQGDDVQGILTILKHRES